MGVKNTYFTERSKDRQLLAAIVEETYVQFCVDIMEVVLNDSDTMGTDTLGCKRLEKVMTDFSKAFDYYCPALNKNYNEVDLLRKQLDDRLKEIFPVIYDFETRYPGLPKIDAIVKPLKSANVDRPHGQRRKKKR